ncbi:unnamed protein product, partial [Brenthis ino]
MTRLVPYTFKLEPRAGHRCRVPVSAPRHSCDRVSDRASRHYNRQQSSSNIKLVILLFIKFNFWCFNADARRKVIAWIRRPLGESPRGSDAGESPRGASQTDASALLTHFPLFIKTSMKRVLVGEDGGRVGRSVEKSTRGLCTAQHYGPCTTSSVHSPRQHAFTDSRRHYTNLATIYVRPYNVETRRKYIYICGAMLMHLRRTHERERKGNIAHPALSRSGACGHNDSCQW